MSMFCFYKHHTWKINPLWRNNGRAKMQKLVFQKKDDHTRAPCFWNRVPQASKLTTTGGPIKTQIPGRDLSPAEFDCLGRRLGLSDSKHPSGNSKAPHRVRKGAVGKDEAHSGREVQNQQATLRLHPHACSRHEEGMGQIWAKYTLVTFTQGKYFFKPSRRFSYIL